MRDITARVLARNAAPKKKPLATKKSFLVKFATTFVVSLSAVGLFLVAPASATDWTGNGTTNGFCNSTSSNPSITGQNWLFILTSPGTGPWTLTATFDPATTPSPITANGAQQGNGSVHFTVNTAAGAQLKSASATGGTDKSNLVVSHCEVGRGSSATSTTLHNASEQVVSVGGSVPLGTVMHDLATVTPSGTIAPTGNVTFTFYTNSACEGNGTAAGTVALNGANPGVAHPSNSTTTLTPGNYAFRASWPGDTNYQGSTSDCENFTVNKAHLSITTAVHDTSHVDKTNGSVPLGSVMHDTATVTGGVNGFPLPAVSFTLTGSYTDSCANGAAVANDGTENGAVKSANSTALGAGSYAYRAVVASDDNYIGSTSVCEPFTVNKAQLNISTIAHDATHHDITNHSVALGAVTHDTATVSGGVAGFPVPTSVSFTLTSNYTHTCSNGAAVANNGTEDSAYKSADSSPLAAGSYAYRASVSGNENYIGADSSCEPFTVNKAQLTVVTNIHDTNHHVVTTVPSGSVVHDTASVSGAVAGFATEAVAFTFYTNNTCTGQGTSVANIGHDEGNATLVRSANSAALAAGFYAYKGSIAGNNNYLGDDSDCEPLTVNAFWCSPGFWKNALDKNRTGVLNYLLANAGGLDLKTTTYGSVVGGAALSKKAPKSNPTLAEVLASPNLYGGPAFNSVADYIAFRLGWGGTQATGENCPLDAHGNFTGSTLSLNL